MSPFTLSNLCPSSEKQSIFGVCVNRKFGSDSSSCEVAPYYFCEHDLTGCVTVPFTLSMVSKMLLAAARPEAKASKQGEA